MKIALLQLNYTVGDLVGNRQKILQAVESINTPVDLIVTSELALTGYPPKDYLHFHFFVQEAIDHVQDMAEALKGAPPLLLGGIDFNPSAVGKSLCNTAFLLRNGVICERFYKNLLPTYDVFDESRYFNPPGHANLLELDNHSLGVTICEDIWNNIDIGTGQQYRFDPVPSLVADGMEVLLNLSASPFYAGKQQARQDMLSQVAQNCRVPVVYVNQVGGNDDLIFDGRSCVFDAQGNLIARAKSFQEDVLIVDLDRVSNTIHAGHSNESEETWNALVLGTRDYVHKCGFKKAVLGLSGGIDSALTAAVAAAALGPQNVTGVLMPSPYSSDGSVSDSLDLAERLRIQTHQLPIAPIMESFAKTLQPVLPNMSQGTTEENIQARIRGALLMAYANENKALLLSTGNKSELAVGYCTLYGDMAGALSVIADVYKMRVYALCRWVNEHRGQLIPQNILTKAPSAELRPNQTDQDSLPPYELLDEIIFRYIEKAETARQLISSGLDADVVHQVVRLIDNSEFKRSQAAVVLKVTERAFGSGWKMPIAAQKDSEVIFQHNVHPQ